MKASFELESSQNEDKNRGASGSGSGSGSSSLGLYGNNKRQRGKYGKFMGGFGFEDEEDDVVSRVVPPVTVVVEGRSICHRISLHNHGSYQSLAKALRQMLVDDNDDDDAILDLSNAIPGHLIAYEDLENDLLLAGDLNWKYVLNYIYYTLYFNLFL